MEEKEKKAKKQQELCCSDSDVCDISCKPKEGKSDCGCNGGC